MYVQRIDSIIQANECISSEIELLKVKYEQSYPALEQAKKHLEVAYAADKAQSEMLFAQEASFQQKIIHGLPENDASKRLIESCAAAVYATKTTLHQCLNESLLTSNEALTKGEEK
jgi:hypothetical protein